MNAKRMDKITMVIINVQTRIFIVLFCDKCHKALLAMKPKFKALLAIKPKFKEGRIVGFKSYAVLLVSSGFSAPDDKVQATLKF